MEPALAQQRHVFAVIVDDEPGVLARVVGLFSGRGYNIESLTVANIDSAMGQSRITIVSTGTPLILGQIEAQLNRVVPVRNVINLTKNGSVFERETALLKLKIDPEHRAAALAIATAARAYPIGTATENVVFELTGSATEINQLVELLRPLGSLEIVRSGILGIAA